MIPQGDVIQRPHVVNGRQGWRELLGQQEGNSGRHCGQPQASCMWDAGEPEVQSLGALAMIEPVTHAVRQLCVLHGVLPGAHSRGGPGIKGVATVAGIVATPQASCVWHAGEPSEQ